MRLTDRFLPLHILKEARRIEQEAGARKNFMEPREAIKAYGVMKEAAQLAKDTGHTIVVRSRQARPDKYGYSGWRYTQWVVRATPYGDTFIELERVDGPANDRSFKGLQCEVEDVNDRELLWQSGQQKLRVVPFNEATIQALKMFAMLLLVTVVASLW